MKKTKIVLISVLFLLLANYSCQVEELEPISTAKSSLETTKKVNPAFLKHDLISYKIEPIWKSAITFENTEAVEVNFTLEKIPISHYQKMGKLMGDNDCCLPLKEEKLEKPL